MIFKGMLHKVNTWENVKYMSSWEICLLFLVFSKSNTDRSQQAVSAAVIQNSVVKKTFSKKQMGQRQKQLRCLYKDYPGNLEPKLFQVPRKTFGLVRKIERKSAKFTYCSSSCFVGYSHLLCLFPQQFLYIIYLLWYIHDIHDALLSHC